MDLHVNDLILYTCKFFKTIDMGLMGSSLNVNKYKDRFHLVFGKEVYEQLRLMIFLIRNGFVIRFM